MDTIFQKITEWLKEMLVSGIMESLSGMFDSVNQQVSDVAAQVGTSPVNFSPGVFAMIRNVSESVIIPTISRRNLKKMKRKTPTTGICNAAAAGKGIRI